MRDIICNDNFFFCLLPDHLHSVANLWVLSEVTPFFVIELRSFLSRHYRLLAFLASHLQGTVITELGTMHGASAIALASGDSSTMVVTYNVISVDFERNAAACGMESEEFLDAVSQAGCRSVVHLVLLVAGRWCLET